MSNLVFYFIGVAFAFIGCTFFFFTMGGEKKDYTYYLFDMIIYSLLSWVTFVLSIAIPLSLYIMGFFEALSESYKEWIRK